MARVLIQRATGGTSLEIDDAALPFFLNQGYVVLDIQPDDDNPADYLTRAASDLRYMKKGDPTASGNANIVVHGSNPNAPRPSSPMPVVWFGTVDPVNADDTLDVWVPVTGA